MDNSPLRRPEPDHLSPEYHKAHKQVMLWAGLLVLWDVLDIDLSAVRTNEGSVGPIITAIKNPRAIPGVLATFVAYFLYKLWLEWVQCSSDRRSRHASVLDFVTACIVAFGALVLYYFKK